MKVVLDFRAFMPERAHATDAGLDLFAPEDVLVPAHGSAVINTGVHMELPPGTCGLLVSKSGLNVKYGITSTGLIDEGYTGAIAVKLYNNSDKDYPVYRGDKVSQLVILRVYGWTEELELATSLNASERGNKGFGSTGR